MKTKLPAKTVHVCDRCHREGYLQTCIVCGNEYCLSCGTTMAGSWVGPDVCRDCGARDDVQEKVARYAEQITPIIKNRTFALERLGQRIRRAR